MTLSHIIDVANAFLHKVSKSEDELKLYNNIFQGNIDKVKQRVNAVRTDHEISWRALLSRLWRIHRLQV